MGGALTYPTPVIQYYSSKLSFPYIMKVIKPLVTLLCAIGLVLISIYPASTTSTYPEKPVVSFPYYLLLGVYDFSGEFDGKSIFSGNFESIIKEDIIPISYNVLFQFSSTDYGFHHVNITVPKYQNWTHLRIILLFSVTFFTQGEITLPQFIDFHFNPQDLFETTTIFGDIFFEQTTVYSSSSGDDFDNFINHAFQVTSTKNDIPDFLQIFHNIPLRHKFLEKSRITDTPLSEMDDSSNMSFIFNFRTSETLIEYKLSYWNLLKNSYVQLFYWWWVVILLWNVFINYGFKRYIFDFKRKVILNGKKEKN